MSPIRSFISFIWHQPWISLKYKRAVHKKMCAYGEAPDAPFSKDFFGLRYEGNLNNSVEFRIFYYDAFEKPLLFFLRDTMQLLAAHSSGQKMQFFDIGANIGQHSLFMSLHTGQVHAFEPYDKVSKKLKHHIQLNQLTNIELHPLGLSDKSEQLDFFAPTGRNQGIGSFDASTVSKGNTRLGKLELVRGDDYLQSRQLQQPDLMKIDVEGFEKNVLRGLENTLKQARPIMVVEISYGGALSISSLEELLALLPGEYRLFTFDTRKADGSKARRSGARAKHSGAYRLVPLDRWRTSGQDDVVACPLEKLDYLPRQGR